MFFLNEIDCADCSEVMRIDIYNKKSRKIIYKCVCGSTCECDFELVGSSARDDLFGLNDSNLITYNCSKCNYSVRDYLSNSYEKNQKILDRAYKCICKKCSENDK